MSFRIMGDTTSLAIGLASARVAFVQLPLSYSVLNNLTGVLRVLVHGVMLPAVPVYVEIGGPLVVASAASGFPVMNGEAVSLVFGPGDTHIAVIGVNGTLRVTPGVSGP